MAEFMMIICEDEQARAKTSEAEIGQSYEKIGAWWGEQEKSGRIIAGSGRRLQPSQTAKTVHVENGNGSVVTDGPFIESKEVVGGYALLNVADMKAAVDVAKSWPGLGVTIELRPIMQM
jgi:hypothetical protein